MYLREKTGYYAGEIRLFPPDVARVLIEQGRAENPYARARATVPQPQSQQGASASLSKPAVLGRPRRPKGNRS